jgi:hypothetical protein
MNFHISKVNLGAVCSNTVKEHIIYVNPKSILNLCYEKIYYRAIFRDEFLIINLGSNE